MEVAQIPARSITILPAIGGAATPASPLATAASTAANVPASTARVTTVAPATPWRWIALSSIGLWLLSVLAWWLWRRRRAASVSIAPMPTPMPTHTSARECQQAFIAAACGSDTSLQVHNLLAWARAERPAIQHLGELAAALGDESQRAAIAALQQRHYAGAPVVEGKESLVEVFKRGFMWRAINGTDDDAVLPPLYPFKLH